MKTFRVFCADCKQEFDETPREQTSTNDKKPAKCGLCGSPWIAVKEYYLRPYGPGKFSTVLDSYVYSVTLEGGCDDEIGSVDENGVWYGLMRNGHTIFKDHDPLLEPLNSCEQDQLTSSAGVIVREDSQGFVGVDYYDTDEELTTAWTKITKELTADDEQEQDNDNETQEN